MCCNHFENWANCFVIDFCCFSCFAVAFYRLLDKERSLMSICSPRGAAHGSGFIKSNAAVGRQIKKARLLSLDLKYLILHGGSSARDKKHASTTCVDPVDLGDSYYDHACLDPESLDADALSQDRRDYMGKNLECRRCL